MCLFSFFTFIINKHTHISNYSHCSSPVAVPFISWAHKVKKVRSLVKLNAPSQSASLKENTMACEIFELKLQEKKVICNF